MSISDMTYIIADMHQLRKKVWGQIEYTIK